MEKNNKSFNGNISRKCDWIQNLKMCKDFELIWNSFHMSTLWETIKGVGGLSGPEFLERMPNWRFMLIQVIDILATNIFFKNLKTFLKFLKIFLNIWKKIAKSKGVKYTWNEWLHWKIVQNALT